MASLVQDLQDLLVAERGQVEAVRAFEDDIEHVDPDIAGGLGDIEQSASWICQGLYHRITQLGGTPTLLTNDLPQRLMEKPELKDRLHILCSEQNVLLHKVNEISKRDDPDKTTRDFLSETKRLHHQTKDWCSRTLAQWKRDLFIPP